MTKLIFAFRNFAKALKTAPPLQLCVKKILVAYAEKTASSINAIC
jgi:hypothetical protein